MAGRHFFVLGRPGGRAPAAAREAGRRRSFFGIPRCRNPRRPLLAKTKIAEKTKKKLNSFSSFLPKDSFNPSLEKKGSRKSRISEVELPRAGAPRRARGALPVAPAEVPVERRRLLRAHRRGPAGIPFEH